MKPEEKKPSQNAQSLSANQQAKKEPDVTLLKPSEAGGLTIKDDRPDYIQQADQGTRAGFEFMEKGDVTLPRLGLCQSGSPQRKSIDPKYIENLKEGDFFNTITGQIYGPKVSIIPMLFFKSRLFFGPMEEGGGLRCQSFDSFIGIGKPGGDCMKCDLAQWHGNEKPLCQLLHCYASLVVDAHGNTSPSQLVVFGLKSTGLGVAKDFNALMRLRNADMYAGVYEITNAMVSNQAKQTWFKPAVKNKGWASKPALHVAMIAYKAVAALKAEGRLKTDVEDLNPEVGKEGPTTEM